jgi:hypothetical protein
MKEHVQTMPGSNASFHLNMTVEHITNLQQQEAGVKEKEAGVMILEVKASGIVARIAIVCGV